MSVTIIGHPYDQGLSIESNVPADESQGSVSPPFQPQWNANTLADYLRLLDGRGTVCLPLAATAEVPSPEESVSSEEIQRVWDQVVKDSGKQVTRQTESAQADYNRQRGKKMQALLEEALSCGNIDMAMLLVSNLETSEVNGVAAGLLRRMSELQGQRTAIADQISKLGNTEDDSKKLQSLNIQVGNIGTEIQTIQTFLQDVMSQKSEAQQMVSNFLKERHETAMAILRNV